MLYIVVIFGVIVDLLSKSYASTNFIDKQNLILDLVYLKYVENTGIAFSIPLEGLVLKLVTIFLIIAIFWYYIFERRKIVKNKGNNCELNKSKKCYLLNVYDLSFGLILAGAIGNGIERILLSRVIDFIGVTNFAVFNLADSFISIGAVLYLYLLLKKEI